MSYRASSENELILKVPSKRSLIAMKIVETFKKGEGNEKAITIFLLQKFVLNTVRTLHKLWKYIQCAFRIFSENVGEDDTLTGKTKKEGLLKRNKAFTML